MARIGYTTRYFIRDDITMRSLFRHQPPALSMIFMLELWERFGYYTMQGILTLYFIRHLGFDDKTAYQTFGAMSALIYGMVVVGGYLGDKVLGIKRTMILGLWVLCLGYFSLALSGVTHVFYALGIICVGNGLFKSNPANLLSKAYEEDDTRLHSGYTLYYMAVNVGSIGALLAGPWVADHFGYPYAFLMSAIGIGLGLAHYAFWRQTIANIVSLVDTQLISMRRWGLIVLGIVLCVFLVAALLKHVMIAKIVVVGITLATLVIYCRLMMHATRAMFYRMLLALILMLEAIVFFTLYQQMPTSLTLFAVHNVHPELLGIYLDPQSFQALNAIWIVVLSPLMAIFYQYLHQNNIHIHVVYKFAAGMSSCACGFLLLFCSRYIHNDASLISSWWLVASYFFQSLGEVLISALGLAMVAELVSKVHAGFVMGMWFLTTAITGFTGAWVASLTALPHGVVAPLDSLMIYTHVFAQIGVVTAMIAVLLWVISPFLVRMQFMTNRADEHGA